MCARIKQGDPDAQTRIVFENEGLIVSLAKSLEVAHDIDLHHYGGIELDDILQEGRLAILVAAKQFDLAGEVRFSSFAYTIMRNSMIDLCRKGNASFERKLAEGGVTQVFLDDDPTDRDGSRVCEKVQEGRVHDPVCDRAVLNVMVQKMRNRMPLLSEKERRVIEYRYGLKSCSFESTRKTAVYFHLTETLTVRIEKSALAKLRAGMNDGKIV